MFDENRDLLEGAYLIGGFSDIAPWFHERYRQRFGDDPDLYSTIGYDASAISFEVLRRHGYTDYSTFLDQLTQVKPALVASQGFAFSPNKQIRFAVNFDRIESGKQVTLLTVRD